MGIIYLDNAATTRVHKEVVEAMLPWLEEGFGNPSSMHEYGFRAKRAIEESRSIIAEHIGCESEEIFFTSGGSESNNTVINRMNLKKKDKLITSTIEHHSVLNAARSLKSGVFYIPVDKNGMIDKKCLETACMRLDGGLVSIMLANNEIGTVQSFSKSVVDVIHSNNFLLHSDATQALGKMRINVDEMGLDFLSASAHKIHGPKGVGFLYARKDAQHFLHPLIKGGQQENGLRAGTENVAGIVGMAKAITLCNEDDWCATRKLSKYLIESIIDNLDGCGINGLFCNNIGGIVNIRFDGVRGEQLVEVLSEHDIYCSSGSACDSHSGKPSHVLKAIGLSDKEANSSVRFSLDPSITTRDIDYVVKVLKAVVPMLKGSRDEIHQ